MTKQRVVVTLLLGAFCALANARRDFFPGQIIPFQPITAEEYNAILDLSNGSPMISEARLIGSGLTAIKGIATNIKNGAMTALNLTGLEPIYSSLFKPNNRVQGYPLCVIRTNRLGTRSSRSFDDGSSDGSFSLNYVHPVIDDDNDDNDDDDDDDENPPYHHYPRPSRPSRRPTRRTTTTRAPDTGSDGSAPVVNCVVVLKRPVTNSTASSTTTTTTTTTPYPHNPHNPHNPHYYHPPYYPPYPPTTTSSSTTTTTTTTTKKPKPNDNRNNLPNPNLQYPYFPYQFIPIPVPYAGWPSNSGNQRLPSSLSAASVPNWPAGQWPWLGNLPGGLGLGNPAGGDLEDAKSGSGSWPRIPVNWQSVWNSRKSDSNDEDKLSHHYFGSAAKTNLYNSQPNGAPEVDDDLDIDADVGDVVDAREAPRISLVRRYRKNQPRALPAIKNGE